MAGAIDHAGLHARLHPEKIAAVDLTSGQSWTYRTFDQAIGQYQAALAAIGVLPGDRVAVLARNDARLILLHLACARLGALYVPLNWRLAAAEIATLLDDCAPRLLIGDGLLDSAGLADQAMRLAVFDADAARLPPAPALAFEADRPSLILYTSGTSGAPKGVLLSEANLAQTALNFSILGAVTGDSVFLCDAPMFHIIGLVTSIRASLLQGARVLISDGFQPPRTLARLADPALAISHYFCVPQMAAALRAEPAFDPARLRHLTAIFTGGAPHPAPAIQAWLADQIAIVDGFGMSEAGTVFGMPLDRALIARRAGSAGIAVPGVATRIVDAAGNLCPPGVAGELQLRGANITQGYWRRPAETAAAFTADGWFRTGDIAHADAEGFHWLVDRQKDMFISGGENIYPAEIEAAAIAHADIAECAAIGVPDDRWGEVGHLLIVLHPGRTLTPESLLAFLEPRLARYKLPKAITIVDSLPRNGAGKLVKGELRRRFVVPIAGA